MSKNPLEVVGVSNSVARVMPIEGGPATEAMLIHEENIPAPWGHYVSTLLEYWAGKGVDYSPTEILNLLGIDREMLRDPSIQFTYEEDFNYYARSRRRDFEHQAKVHFQPEVDRLHMIIDAIQAGYKVEDPDFATERHQN